MKVNEYFDRLVPNYLFADVARKTGEFAAAHPEKEIIRLGIGDVTLLVNIILGKYSAEQDVKSVVSNVGIGM